MEKAADGKDDAQEDELVAAFSALSLERQRRVFSRLGAEPCGYLYAYCIPVHEVVVCVDNERRGFHHMSSDWVLLNMGMGLDASRGCRLDKMARYHEGCRPNKRDHLVYRIGADTSWEGRFRRACYLGGNDVGGNAVRAQGYFGSAREWEQFLGPTGKGKTARPALAGVGLTECAIVPRAAFERLRTLPLPVYPRMRDACQRVHDVVHEEMMRLVGDRVPRRGSTCTVRIFCTSATDAGPVKEYPFFDVDKTEF